MPLQRSLAAVLLAASCATSDASYEPIAGYAPGSKVTDHNAIDLDQKAIEMALSQSTIDYTLVKNIYEQGGNSKAYAEFQVQALPQELKKGDAVVQMEGNTPKASGKVYSTTEKDKTTLKVAYSTSDKQATYVGCKGGALTDPPQGETASATKPYKFEGSAAKCFGAQTLKVTTGGGEVTVTPTADPVNKAGRTLQGFSTKAGALMRTKGSEGGCGKRSTDGCPYVDFSQYYDYYGDDRYADKLVLAAITSDKTAFTKDGGDMDFSGSATETRKEIIKKGTAYMNAYMYAIREFEDAIDDCNAGCRNGISGTESGKNCNELSTNAVHAWDEGVAFYTGSREGSEKGGNNNGVLAYRLAEKRCKNFKTCGPSMDLTSGVSFVNTKLFQHLGTGKDNLLKGKCEETKPILRDMVAIMAVPLIQGTLRYAYKVGELAGGDKEKGEGAIFAAAVVPRVFKCNNADGQTIMNNMKISASETDFEAVKEAFEKNYECMGITCAHVGGLVQGDGYYEGAAPCGTSATTTKKNEVDVSRAPHSGVLSLAAATGLLAAAWRLLAL